MDTSTSIALVLLLLVLLMACLLGLAVGTIRRRSDQALKNLERVLELEGELSELRSHLNLLRSWLDLVDDSLVHLDGRKRIKYLNESARRLIGPQEGRMLTEAVRDHDLDSLFRRSITEGRDQSAIVRLSWPPRLVRARVSLLGAAGILLAMSDQTELDHLQRVRRELVANVSHELRTPLSTLSLVVETLIGGAVDDPEARDDFLQRLHEQVEHLSGIVEQSLYLASLESGETHAEFEAVSVHELVRTTLRRLQPQIERSEVDVKVSIPEGLPPVNADFQQIGRVLTSLLENALKWTPSGGRVTVAAVLRDELVRFEVRDTGPGVAPEVLPRLFERFYKSDPSRSEAGTGLGLAIAKHTVIAHGGDIWAENAKDGGASFRFTLPAASTQ